MVVALDQGSVCAIARRSHRGGDSGRASSYHQDFRLSADLCGPRRLDHLATGSCHIVRPLILFSPVLTLVGVRLQALKHEAILVKYVTSVEHVPEAVNKLLNKMSES